MVVVVPKGGLVQNTRNDIPRVGIIMSAYNAQQFIGEQVDSILGQVGVQIRLWIRDDGSTDSTFQLLRAEYAKDPRVVLTRGPNLGATRSFIEALFAFEGDIDYAGFADADDVWHPLKTAKSVHRLQSSADTCTPAAIACRMQVVDERLRPLMLTPKPRLGLDFGNSLVQTVCGGASTLMNRAAFERLRSRQPRPEAVTAHDSWTYLVLAAFGKIGYLDEPLLEFRQHAANVSGSHSMARRNALRLERLQRPSPRRAQAAEFARLFASELSGENARVLQSYLEYPTSFSRRLSYALALPTRKQSRRANAMARALVLLAHE